MAAKDEVNAQISASSFLSHSFSSSAAETPVMAGNETLWMEIRLNNLPWLSFFQDTGERKKRESNHDNNDNDKRKARSRY